MQSLKHKLLLLCALLLIAVLANAQQTEIQYLSGTGNDRTVKWDFYCTAGMNAGKWTPIAVPSCWELQGFGKYDYGFAKDSLRGKEQGLYKYSFRVPADWKQKKINIVFEGVMTDATVHINGKSAGATHQGAFYSFKYDISSLLKYGEENLLEVTVAKHSANKSVNDAERKADFWLFGGIFRPVFLEALPLTHIEQVAIDAKADGSFRSLVAVQGDADQVGLQLYNSKGVQFGTTVLQKLEKEASSVRINTKYSQPELWSAEFPNLYKAVITLYKQGKPVHAVGRKIGFRTVEVKQRDGIYVNGMKMKFKGVNRHSFWPASGRTTSRAISIEDVQLMKDMNMNAVRMSHYPPDAHFLETCDSLGLYVMDELAGWHGRYDAGTGSKLLKEMLQHDVNHPSIVIWSNGNEGGHNPDFDPMFKAQDIQQRPVVHPWELFGGIETQHYREYNYGIGTYEHGHEILMPTEFLHGLYDGGHGAGLEDYWESMWHNPLAAGGFLWDFADEGVVRTDKDGMIDTDGNHGADGIVGPYHEKEGSYYAIKEIWCPLHIEKKEITDQFDGTLMIENRYAFINTKQCSFSWKLASFTGRDTKNINGKVIAPDIKPLAKGKLLLLLPANWKRYDVLYLTASDPHGKELFTWSFPIADPAKIAAGIVKKEGTGEVKIKTEDTVYHVSSGTTELLFSRTDGKLLEVKNEGKLIPFHNGPVLQEGVNNFGNFQYRYEGRNLVIESGFDRKKNYNTLQWTIYPGGWVSMHVNYFPGEYFTFFDGVNFSFPEKEIKAVEYLGKGPYRVWKNRMKGGTLGIWNKNYNDTETGESWNYPEFKGYYANLYWCRFITSGQPFTVVSEDEDVFLRLFTPAFKTDQWKNYEPLFPSGDISFMQGIPGIGTKTQRNETTGPMGMKNIYYDYDKTPSRAKRLTLYFNFSSN